MRAVAVLSAKGGVGKTTLAVNLAHASATVGGRQTLLWDLDPQSAATWLMRASPRAGTKARHAIAGDQDLRDCLRETNVPGLLLLPADRSLRRLEGDLARTAGQKQVRRLLKSLARDFDRVILDVPPGLSELSERILSAVDLVVMPSLPTPLSARAEAQLAAELARRHDRGPALLPVWNMVDRRRALHRRTVAAAPERPVIPYSAAIEAMAIRQAPIAAHAAHNPVARAFGALYTEVERALLRAPG